MKLPLHCIVLCLLFAAMLSPAAERQIAIPRVDAMPDFPQPFEMRDWRKVTLDYVDFVTDFEKRGDRLPVIGWADSNRTMVTMPSYVGAPMHPPEALNFLAMVVSGSLAGLDMRSYRGVDWVAMTTNYFSESCGVIVNNPHGGTGGSFWYDVYPGVLFCQVCALYPGDVVRDTQMKHMAERWRDACLALCAGSNSLPDFDHTAFDLQTMKPRDNGKRVEPEGGAGIAWIEFMVWKKFGDARFLEASELALRAIESRPAEKNPLYEVLLPYGALVAARMNKELGRNYDVAKLVNWCFEPGDRPQARPFWGVIADRFGNYDCSGLAGSSRDSGGYAFAMNSFAWAGALVPLARYDERYANAIGKWILNLANASRLFYPNALPTDHQDHRDWSDTNDPASCIAYEGLRKCSRKYDVNSDRIIGDDSIQPHATGDAQRNKSGALNLCLYGSSHAGYLGGMISRTETDGILKIDLLKSDWFHNAADSTFLLFNPHVEAKTITIGERGGNVTIAAKSARVISNGASGVLSRTASADNRFVFTITADSHLDDHTEIALYQRTLSNAVADKPAFHVDLGDTFMSEKLPTREIAANHYLDQRRYFDVLPCPLYLVTGNHDGEDGRFLDGTTNNLATWSRKMRLQYFPNPLGAITNNFFSWRHGNALFIALDPFWYSPRARRNDDNWFRTLGEEQYRWLERTLETNTAAFTFVFIHHLVGGRDRQGRGGIEAAPFYEWGGKNADGSEGFKQHRPGWPAPIHQLLVKRRVSAVFHGHDHLFAKQDLDGVVYQECPQPGDPHGSTRSAAEYGCANGVIFGSAGHLRVTVQADATKVHYVHADGSIAHSYSIASRAETIQ